MSPANDTPAVVWHSLGTAEAAERLKSPADGLSGPEAAQRLGRFGPNQLPSPPRQSALLRFLRQFHNVLIYLLVVAAIAAWLLGHPVDSAVIGIVVLANALIGYVQEGKAARAMEAIGAMVGRSARVRRDGCWQRIDAQDLVPGDRVKLKPGDRVPADLRLLECHGLGIDEAPLTGESMPVSKRSAELPVQTPLAERLGMAWSGTLVVKGEAEALVVETGAATEIGRISGLLGEVQHLVTPLLQQITRFGQRLSLVILAVSGLLMLLAWLLHGQMPAQTFMAAVALAVAAIPEGLPAIITITLAVGVRRMAARKAIVRRLPAVETLGSVDTICSDKTGTLTSNELQATHLTLAGELKSREDWLQGDCEHLRQMAEAAVLGSEAERLESADPLEAALLHLAESTGLQPAEMRARHPRTALLPFASEYKLMATRHADQVYLKGAPERVLARCRTARGCDALEIELWQQRLASMAGDGLRVLALARRPAAGESGAMSIDQLGEGFELLGLIGFSDPPRPAVPAAIRACRDAGIRVKMITGDHAETALAIATQIGIDTDKGALNGADLDALQPDELAKRAEQVNVFARTSPENKLRLVEALQAQGRVVAMTGDGVNDAPALKRADIGVAMGQKGTEAAREAAEMVLADDNFATIVSGVEEGRGVYDNIRKTILFALPTNTGEALVILIAVVAGVALPLTPVQLLWVNTVTAITLALALAFEPLENDVMARPPRPRNEGLVDRFTALRALWVGLSMMLGTFGLYLMAQAAGASQAEARTVALNTLVVCEMVYLFNVRRWLAPSWHWRTLIANPWALWAVVLLAILQLLTTYLPIAQGLLGTAAIGLREWLWVGGFGVLLFAVIEVEKAWLLRRRGGGLH